MNPVLLGKIGEATGRFAMILAKAIQERWSEEEVMEAIRREKIVSNAGLQAMRDADKIRDEYVGD